jgi:hypothetical protein
MTSKGNGLDDDCDSATDDDVDRRGDGDNDGKGDSAPGNNDGDDENVATGCNNEDDVE